MPIVRVLRHGSKPYTHSAHGEKLHFEPNERGHLLCDVQSQAIVDILLGYEGGGFVLYEDADHGVSSVVSTVSTEPVVDPDPTERYVIGEGEQRLDLRLLGDKQLHEFCKLNAIEINANAKGDTIRDRILESLTEPGEA